MQTPYEPIVTEIRMSDFGYWVVTLSVSPGVKVSTMIASVGVSESEAVGAALATLGSIPDQEVPR